MRRWPLVVTFLLFIALCASAAYWAMQLFKPPLRPVAAPPRVAQAEVRTDAAAGLFGGRGGKAAVASNYQLKGVIFSGRPQDSVAILSADGKPPQAIRVDMEVLPGVTVKEVHRDYVLLSDNGVTKRVDLPEDAKAANVATASPLGVVPAPTRPTSMPPAPQPQSSAAPQSTPPQPAPPVAQQPAPPQPAPPQPAPPPAAQAPAPATPVQTAPPTTVVNTPQPAQPAAPAAGAPASPSGSAVFGTQSPPLYSPGRAGGAPQ
ncbi:hypothetical protein D3870_01730 [Noviherbaspirillum cavernae]|uniref:Type II secretion system protein GspC N-terminal domain-containing protein n=1 Tax=Noviherbaspirillum cavernae TaxID=2320862 RepID=A0A418WXG6_9BURK|nr:type II secretion system protein N [Noviherbaspirillum cavernae]RJG04914.1 hypothetical protein D3870_01730 [Noviherbaspirillum cavernae]